MLALRKTHPGTGVELHHVPEPPAPGPGEALIEVAATGICGTDLGIDDWIPMYKSFMANALPVTIGHETAGRVVALGTGVQGLATGDRVVVNPAVACGRCIACDAGMPDDCRNRQAIGLIRDGAFARYMLAPASYLYRLPANVPTELGALAEPLTTSAHALTTAGMAPGKRVVVFGPGPIGQGAALIARQMGATDVTVVGLNDAARFGTLAQMGFENLVDMREPDAAARLSSLAGDGFDIAIEAAGVPVVIDQALAVLRPWGVLAVAGMPEAPATVDILKLVRNRLQIRGVSRAPRAAWTIVLEALAKEPDAFAPMITHRLPLTDALRGFSLCEAREASKVLIYPQ
ncbi:MAG TPA: alcohol dehydrogenase catalytic domain-containing protein [Rhizomicrobium sp.]